MVLLTVSLIIALVFAVIATLVWLFLRVFGVRNKGRKIFKAAGLCFVAFLPLFFFVISPLLLSRLIAYSSTRPQEQNITATPETWGAGFVSVEFPSRDGLNLSGWFMEGEAGAPVFILCHGLFRSRHEMLQRACSLHRLGYGALLFDFRNHGKSGRSPVSLGFHERLDVLGACDYLRQSRGKTRLVLLGVSMGAAAALHAAAAWDSPLEAIVADSPFLNLKETVAQHVRLFLRLPPFPFADLFIWNLTRLGNYQVEQLDTALAVQRIHQTPLLLIYGKEDRRIPASTAQALFDAIPHDRKQLVFFEGAGHGAAYRSDPERYIQLVAEFVRRN